MHLPDVSSSTQSQRRIAFWDWFVANELVLSSMTDPRFNLTMAERKSDAQMLSDALALVNPDLSWAINHRDAECELVISASGELSLFPEVLALSKAAPQLPAPWIVTPFQQRSHEIGPLAIRGIWLSPADIEFAVFTRPDGLGIVFFLEKIDADHQDIQLALCTMFLHSAIGEYDAAMLVRQISLEPSSELLDVKRSPYKSLRGFFDQVAIPAGTIH